MHAMSRTRQLVATSHRKRERDSALLFRPGGALDLSIFDRLKTISALSSGGGFFPLSTGRSLVDRGYDVTGSIYAAPPGNCKEKYTARSAGCHNAQSTAGAGERMGLTSFVIWKPRPLGRLWPSGGQASRRPPVAAQTPAGIT